jgi:LuxR family maltose regulon positive regulatory protein
MEDNLEGNSNAHCYFNYDAALGWYYLTLRCLDMVPAWAREVFTSYHHAYFVENFGNQIKARYHYLARDYAPLLAFIEGSKRRESILYGRIEMLALEACTHLQMKNKSAALDALNEAYVAAKPNNILMPFIELGKDMRTLAASALRDTSCKIEPQWLEKTMRKAASFAKHQSLIISDFEKTNGRRRNVALSTREREVLLDMYHGLTRPEIAARQELSNNTVNSTINSIFNKLGAHSTADAVRVAAEEKLV